MSKLGDDPIYKARKERKLAELKRNINKEKLNRKVELLTDLTDVLSKRKLTIKDVGSIVEDLIIKGWTKKEFQKRKWNK